MNKKTLALLLFVLALAHYSTPAISSAAYDYWLCWKIEVEKSPANRALLIRSTEGRNLLCWAPKYKKMKDTASLSEFELEALRVVEEKLHSHPADHAK